MTTSTICQTAAAARESARQSTGKFGEQAHSNPGRDLVEKATHIAKSEWSRTSSWGRTGAADYDDFAQDAMLELLERRAKAGDRTADAAHGGIEIDVSDWATSASGANMRQVAKRSMRIMYLGEKNGNAVGARRKLAELDREFTEQHGRPMSNFEREQAAEQVRMSIDTKSRPPKGFHLGVALRTMELDATANGNHSSLVRSSSAEDDALRSGTDEVDRVWDVMDSEPGRTGKQEAKRGVYTALASASGSVLPKADTLSPEQATKARKAVKAYGGAAALARDWMDAECDDEQADALFEPFGDLDQDQRQDVCSFLGEHSGYADDLWSSAISYATRAKKTRA